MAFKIHVVRSEGRRCLAGILPLAGTLAFDPFLALREEGPPAAPGFQRRSSVDPERAFESLTYVVAGAQFRRDAYAQEDIIRAGGLRRTIVAAGTAAPDSPTEVALPGADAFLAFTVVLGLSRDIELTAARYRVFDVAELPIVKSRGVWVRLLAGAQGGVRAPYDDASLALFAHVRLKARADVAFALKPGATTLVYALDGSAQIGPQPIVAGELGSSRETRTYVALAAQNAGFEALVLSAMPVGEALVRSVREPAGLALVGVTT